MKLDSDILIAGGGLNGSSLALALAQSGLSVTIVDPTPAALRKAAGFDGRGYALSLASQRLLQAIGIWKVVAARSQPILEIRTLLYVAELSQGPSLATRRWPFILIWPCQNSLNV